MYNTNIFSVYLRQPILPVVDPVIIVLPFNITHTQVIAEEVSTNKQMLELQFSAQGLDKKVRMCQSVFHYLYIHIMYNTILQDFLGKSDPYLQFSRQNPDGSYSPVHKIPVCFTFCLVSC